MTQTQVLSAPHSMEFPYTRSTGPMVGAFLTGLRDKRVLGVRDSAAPFSFRAATRSEPTGSLVAEVSTCRDASVMDAPSHELRRTGMTETTPATALATPPRIPSTAAPGGRTARSMSP